MVTPSSAVELATQMRSALDDLATPGVGLGDHLADEVCALRLLLDRVEAVYLERLASLDASGAVRTGGWVSTATWLSRSTRISARKAKADVTMARRLHTDPDRPLRKVAESLSAGELTVEHVRAIVTGTARVPIDRMAEAEEALVQVSKELNAGLTGRAAQRIHQLLMPDDALERREWARSQRDLDLVQTFQGMWWIQGLLSPESGAALAAVLEPLARPVRSDGVPDDRSAGQRRADALGQLASWAASAGMPPRAGGIRPQVAVRIDLGDLMEGRLGEAWIGRSTGEGRGGPISLWAARRIACDASLSWIAGRDRAGEDGDPAGQRDHRVGLVDQVGSNAPSIVAELLRDFAPALGGLPWEVLAVGRSTRLVTSSQRSALNARDRGCVYPGCDRPPEWCDAHHLVHWADGGPTDLDNLALVCEHHHTVIHERDLVLTPRADGRFEVRPRAPSLNDTG